MAEFRCFDTYALNNYTSSDYIKKKKRKTLFVNAQTIAIGNSNYQQGISANAIPPGYLQKKSGGTYYTPVYVGTKQEGSRCLIGATSYDVLYDVLYGAKPYNDTYKEIATNITNSLPIPPQDWVGNMMQIDFISDATNSIIGPAISPVPNGTKNKMDYTARQDFLPAYDDPHGNPPIDFPGMVIDPSYNIFYPQCQSKYKINNYLKNVRYNSSILFSSPDTLQGTITLLNNKLYQSVKRFPYPLDFSASRCLTEQELIDLIFPPPPPPPTFFDYYGTSFSVRGNAVLYGGGVWVAVGNDGGGGNTILASSDGYDWQSISGTQFEIEGISVAYDGNGRWIAVGQDTGGNTILKSDDGFNWSVTAGSALVTSKNVAYGEGVWVAVGESVGNTILISQDGGDNWTTIFSGSQFSVLGNSVAYGNGWVAVGDNGGGGNTILTSSDGLNWSTVSGTQFSGHGNDIAYGGKGRWVAVGESIGIIQTILTSSDRINWIPTTGVNFDTFGNSITYGGGVWVALGCDTDGIILKKILASTNGIEWVVVSGTQFNIQGKAAFFGGSRWIAVGEDSGSNTILTSVDGLSDWELAYGTLFTNEGTGVAFGNGEWACTGTGPTILYGYTIM